MYVIAIVAGSTVTALVINLLKKTTERPVAETPEPYP